ncbi:mpv17-like protein [Condylostylus longicornis]|uniref:mpv17-like protein n=1 Tax=Condylostylus longicornis TaxID=2530218 RepID=UPI00244DFDA6|nr:mpv17-like protein [Condylostylus longicornis]
MLSIARQFFNKNPLIANSIVYGSLYVGAEFSQQYINKKILAPTKEKIDMPTLGRYAVMGTFCYSPTLYTWYKWLDGTFPGSTHKIVVKKLLLDQFVLTPFLLTMFYIGMSLMEQKDDLLLELKQKFIPTFQTSCLFWLPAQTVNFLFISPKLRVIYVGSCAFAWVNILCWFKRQAVQEKPQEN